MMRRRSWEAFSASSLSPKSPMIEIVEVGKPKIVGLHAHVRLSNMGISIKAA